MAELTYGLLAQTHPEYRAAYWRRLRAFHDGGESLLADDAVMSDVFPRHREEHDSVYRERKKRAFYLNYAGEIVGYIVSQLMAERLVIESDAESLPDFYRGFLEDVSAPGGERCSLHEFMRGRVLEALICKKSWTLVDLPQNDPVAYASLGDQERAGALNAYLVPVATESVIDWEQDEGGELTLGIVYTTHARRLSVSGDRSRVTHRWDVYTRDRWKRYEIEPEPGKKLDDRTPVPLVAEGAHSFGRVPLVPLCLPGGLWVMNQLESAAREHFNKRSALGWGETQALLPELYEYLGPEVGGLGTPIGEAQQDPSRALTSRRGQGYVQVRGAGDKAEFVGPDPAAFTAARESCRELRDEMHRITYQMALTVDNSGAALKRSGDSKAQDRAATTVVLNALGAIVRRYSEVLMDMVSAGRREGELVGQWHAKGLDQFDGLAASEVISQAEAVELIKVPSETFQRRWKMKVVKACLGEDLTPDDAEAIETELDRNIMPEQLTEPEPTDVADGESE